MKILTLFAVAVAAAVFAASAIFASGRHVLTCASNEGRVNTYVPGLSSRSCHTPMASTPGLYATETLRTQVGGSFDFHTNHLDECKQVPTTARSVDQVLPHPNVAILHLGGLTWCRHEPTDKQSWLKTKNRQITIQPQGTILGLDTVGKGTTLKVAVGSALVSLPGVHPIVVQQQSQLFIPDTGSFGRPTKLQLTPTDATAVTELELGVKEGGSKQFSEYLRVRKQFVAAVIAPDAATAQQQAALLPKVKVTQLLSPDMRANPQQAVVELDQLAAGGVKTLITVGTVSQMTPVWTLINGAGLPATEVTLFAATG